MGIVSTLLQTRGLAPPLAPGDAERAAAALGESAYAAVYPRSIAAKDGVIYFLARDEGRRRLGLVCGPGAPKPSAAGLDAQRREVALDGLSVEIHLAEPDHRAAQRVRHELPFTVPRLVGLACSVGCGDRLGVATPGHVRAVRGRGVVPFFAQQSIREMARTGRSPEQVMDDALWGVLQEGYRDGFGADADHLKTAEDVANCVEAGFTMFTIDPGDHVNNAADGLPLDLLEAEFQALPWTALEETAHQCLSRYSGLTVDLGAAGGFAMTRTALLRAAVKYGAAVAHTAALYRTLSDLMAGRPFELEMSVDETATPTSAAEHFYVATELRRLGVQWVGLAPRFVGDFEKGVDYKGSLAELETSLAEHAAVARQLGPYKLSIHSGSDKFSVYPIAAQVAGDLVHVKTAGTSYLEALRVVGEVDPPLFREILGFAHERYETDKATYHVSANPAVVPKPEAIKDADLARVLDGNDGRQMLHVTYGSVLQAKAPDGAWRFRDRLMKDLNEHEERYAEVLEQHLGRHVAPFGR
jgi:hypothetical protein